MSGRSGPVRILVILVWLAVAVEALLSHAQWSPEQIARWLALHGVARISHMTIYRHVHRDRLAGGNLRCCLRQAVKRRRKRTFGPERRGKLHGKPM